MVRILVVEDHENIRKLMLSRLSQEGYTAVGAVDGEDGMRQFELQAFDLIICDLMMPKVNGYDLISKIRSMSPEIPILIITAKDSFEDKALGFKVGSDDYMVKPIHLSEMVLRVSALLRRAKIANEKQLVFNGAFLDYDKLTVTIKEVSQELPKKEFFLLFKLLSYPKQIFTRQQLLDDIWGIEAESDERVIDTHIKKLRKRFENNECFDIVTIRGLGYKAEKGTLHSDDE